MSARRAKACNCARPDSVLQIELRGQLAAPGIDHERLHGRQMRSRDVEHVGTMRRERAPTNRTGDHARQIEHAHARQRTFRLRQCNRRRIADPLDGHHWQSGDRPCRADARPTRRTSASWRPPDRPRRQPFRSLRPSSPSAPWPRRPCRTHSPGFSARHHDDVRKFVCRRTQRPSPQRYAPAILSQVSPTVLPSTRM